jgi:hypothetical protein
MNAQTVTMERSDSTANASSTLIKNLLLATLIAGTLDAIAGIVVYDLALGQMGIVQILQWIASGAFGKQAFEMGLLGAFYGVVFHYIVAFFASLAVFAVKSKIKAIEDYPVITGLAYGGWVWVCMNFIVLPNSNTVLAPFSVGVALTGYIWHMLFVGLPITFFASKK